MPQLPFVRQFAFGLVEKEGFSEFLLGKTTGVVHVLTAVSEGSQGPLPFWISLDVVRVIVPLFMIERKHYILSRYGFFPPPFDFLLDIFHV